MEYIASTSVSANGSAIAVFSAVLTAPLSRGNLNLSINFSSPLSPPVINLGWFTNPADTQVAIAVFKRLRQGLSSIPELMAGPELSPGAAIETDEQILEYVRDNAMQIWHGSATCKMGAAQDPMAVLDSHAKVRGVQSLRVVDISSFPFALPGHPQSSVYMLAEKIADDIIAGL